MPLAPPSCLEHPGPAVLTLSRRARVQSGILLTGGEDAKLNVWTAAGAEPAALGSPTGKAKRWNDVDPMDVDMDGDVASRKRRRA